MKAWIKAGIGIAVAGGLVIGAYLWYLNGRSAQPEKVVRSYFEAVAAGRASEIEDQLIGNARTAFARAVSANPTLPRGALTQLHTQWVVMGPEIAVADVTAGVKLLERSGAVDTQAARVALTKTAGGWRIYQIEPIPLPYDSGFPVSEQEARQAVEQYVTLTAEGKYEEALTFLAGRARNDAEATLPVLRQAKVHARVADLRVTKSQAGGGVLWLDATYMASIGEEAPRNVRLLFEVRQVGGRPVIVRVSPISAPRG